jgi:hypothetical protein
MGSNVKWSRPNLKDVTRFRVVGPRKKHGNPSDSTTTALTALSSRSKQYSTQQKVSVRHASLSNTDPIPVTRIKPTSLTPKKTGADLYTVYLNINPTFRPHSMFMSSVRFAHETATVCLQSTKRSVFVNDTQCVYCDEGTEFLNTIHTNTVPPKSLNTSADHSKTCCFPLCI